MPNMPNMGTLAFAAALLLTLVTSGPVLAAYCAHDAQACGTYCRMKVATGTPDSGAAALATKYVEYCREDEFDGAEVCVVIAERQEPLDVEIELHRAAGGAWLLVISSYFDQMEEMSESLEIKVDEGPVRSFRGSGGSRGYQGEGPIITVRQLFPVDRPLLEEIAGAMAQIWFRFKQEDGSQRDLIMQASEFSLLERFIAEAGAAFGDPAPGD